MWGRVDSGLNHLLRMLAISLTIFTIGLVEITLNCILFAWTLHIVPRFKWTGSVKLRRQVYLTCESRLEYERFIAYLVSHGNIIFAALITLTVFTHTFRPVTHPLDWYLEL